MRTYIFTTCLSFLLALASTPLTVLVAHRFGIVDIPNARSSHAKSTARAGGIAVFFSVMLVIFPVLMLDNAIGEAFRDIHYGFFAVISGAALMFIVGLFDDLFGLRARYKLLAQLTAAFIVCFAGVRIQYISVQGLFDIDLGFYSWPLTMLWLVGVTNAVNLIDGLDGLAAGISAIVCGFLAILAVYFGNQVMAVLMLAMVGSLVGFLFFNFNPAKIFLGDCGSLFIGFMIAAASVLTSTKSHALVGVALPVLALGIPIFDTFFAMLRRFIQRRSMFAPDKSHFHHRLLDHGFGHAHVAVIAYAVTIIIASMGLFLMVTRSFASILVFASSLLLLVLMFRIVGSVRLRETMAGLKYKRAVMSMAKEEIKNFEEAQLHFRNAKNFDDWWESVCLAAEKLDFTSVTLPITNRDGSCRFLEWKASKPSAVSHKPLASNVSSESKEADRRPLTADSSGNLNTASHSKQADRRPPTAECCDKLNTASHSKESENYSLMNIESPIRDRRNGRPLRLKIQVCTASSVESAGRRAALFARLVEEHSVTSLVNENSPEPRSDSK